MKYHYQWGKARHNNIFIETQRERERESRHLEELQSVNTTANYPTVSSSSLSPWACGEVFLALASFLEDVRISKSEPYWLSQSSLVGQNEWTSSSFALKLHAFEGRAGLKFADVCGFAVKVCIPARFRVRHSRQMCTACMHLRNFKPATPPLVFQHRFREAVWINLEQDACPQTSSTAPRSSVDGRTLFEANEDAFLHAATRY